MQTFLPYQDFQQTAQCLDYRRLGKQRVEAFQILNILLTNKTSGGWVNHPAVNMWRGYEGALKLYINTVIDEWVNRGYKNNMLKYEITKVNYPNIFFHNAHKSNLLRKDPVFYNQYNWNVSNDLEYIWPKGDENG